MIVSFISDDNKYLGIECPFCGAEFHQTREAAGMPCIVHPTAMETNKDCLLDGNVWIATRDIADLWLKISQRSSKISKWMQAHNIQTQTLEEVKDIIKEESQRLSDCRPTFVADEIINSIDKKFNN